MPRRYAAGPAEERIEQARLDRATTLDLSGLGLDALPMQLSTLSGLQALWLSHNHLRTLPEWLPDLTRLKALILEDNRIAALPKGFEKLSELITLSLAGNRYFTLPDAVSSLSSLQNLDISRNPIRELPPWLGSLGALRSLAASDTDLTALPDRMGSLSELAVLKIARNGIIKLPTWLSAMPQLAELDVAGNPLSDVPLEVVAAGGAAVLRFLRDMEQNPDHGSSGRRGTDDGSSRQWAGKLIIVGDGGVGKTSLIKALTGQAFDPHEAMTHGMRLTDVELPHPDRDGTIIRMSAWDFGGQDIYQATHQLFLTPGALVVLVCRARSADVTDLGRWLDAIADQVPDALVAIVVTHQHEHSLPLPLRELRTRHPGLVGVHQVENATGAGIPQLRAELGRYASKLPSMGMPWPNSWLAAAAALLDRADDAVPTAEMWRIMAAAGLEDPASCQALAQTMHQRGDIVYFAQSFRLGHLVILRPEWLNMAIHALLDHLNAEGRAEVLPEDLDVVWPERTHSERELFLDLMAAYDLGWRIYNDEFAGKPLFLAVGLLSTDPIPELDVAWHVEIGQYGPGLRLRYRFSPYETPRTLIGKIIARTHRYDAGTRWRRGVLLSDGPATARIDEAGGSVELAVTGPEPAPLMHVLDDIVRMSATQPMRTRMEILIPCPCQQHGEPCPREYALEDVQGMLARGDDHVTCHKSGTEVSVAELRYGVRTSTAAGEVSASLAALKSDIEAVQRNQRLLLQGQKDTCPMTFTLVPTTRLLPKLRGTKVELRLWCEAKDAIHPLPEGIGCYELSDPPAWLLKTAPVLSRVLAVLKTTAMVTVPVVGLAVPHMDKRAQDDIKKMTELLDHVKSLKLPDTEKELPGADRTPKPSVHGHTEGAQRAVHAFLDKVARDGVWGGLSRHDADDGNTYYLCEAHLSMVKPSLDFRRSENSP